MKKLTLFLAILMLQLNVNAQIPSNYYNTANGLTGYALKSQLRAIITNGHINRGYDNLYNGYQTTDTDHYYENDGTVLDMYSENPNGQDPYNYTHNNNKCGNYSNEGDCYNREHLFPQSWFGSGTPKSDIHQVVPSDGKVNGQRGHYPLADVGSASWTSQNGSKRGTCSDTGYNGTAFEPIDEFKGDIARIYFYMATRYENQIGGWENANNSSDAVLDGSSNQVYEDWYVAVLLQWHHQDPVSQREIDRNNAAYDYQGNANPFISHPEWVDVIWNPVPDTVAPSTPTNLTASNITETSVDLTWTASTDDVSVIGYHIYQDGILIDSTPNTNYTVINLTGTTNYSFYVVAYDAAPNTSANSNTVNITTLDAPTYLINENFDNCDTSSAFFSFSEASTDDWKCETQYGENNSACIQMNGWDDTSALSKDWLITVNAIDFSQYVNEKLSVFLVHKYGDMSLELLYSTDYIGTGNPVNYTWLPVPNVAIDTHDGSSSEVTQIITDADISALNQTAYIAFKYYESTAPTRWTVDSFKITGDVASSVQDNLFSESITVYPNPSFEVLNIKTNTQIKSVSLFDYLGKQVYSQQNKTAINISSLNNGIYILKIEDAKGNIAFKKVIKK